VAGRSGVSSLLMFWKTASSICVSDKILLPTDECGSDRTPFILVPSVLSVLPLEGWQSW
jgi:hypothetical protein